MSFASRVNEPGSASLKYSLFMADASKKPEYRGNILAEKYNFEDHYLEHKDSIQRFFEKRGCGEESQDLTQQTFLKAHVKKDQILNQESYKAWLFVIAKNNYRNYLRSKAAKKNQSDTISLSDNFSLIPPQIDYQSRAHSPLNAILKKEHISEVEEALNQLPNQMRNCLFLFVFQNLKYKEIASILNLKLNTVKSHIFNAREKLKASLNNKNFMTFLD